MRVTTSIIALAGLAITVPADATITRLVGGPGGGPSTLQCAEGQMVVGLRARAGDWFDGIYALCSAPRSGAREISQYAGGGGGEIQEYYCPEGQWIDGLKVTVTYQGDDHNEYVNAIGFSCAGSSGSMCISTGEGCETGPPHRVGDRTFAGAPAISVSCPAGEGAVAVTTRSGSHLDAVGLICGPIHPTLAGAGGAVSTRAPSMSPRPLGPSAMAPSTAVSIRAAGSSGFAAAPGDCAPGLVWREASPMDHVCVTPASRDRVAAENRQAGARVDPANAPNCLMGYVWREAFPGDTTCVTPESRDLARAENSGAGATEKIR